jgi:FG-GAP-like repeat/FG-GAP repeat
MLLGGACIEAKTYTPLPPPDPTIPTVPRLRMPQNDAYEGSVVLGRLQPRFAWEPSTVEAGEVRYELQYSADATFAQGVTTVATEQRSIRPDAALAVSTRPPVGRRYYWRVRACAGETCSEYSRPWWVNLGRSMKDFNGDGYDDVIVGSHTSIDEVDHPGRVYVYFGALGPSFNSVVRATLRDFATESWFGSSVAAAGDFNGDGYADLVVGAPKSNFVADGGGRAYLYFGGPGTTFDATPDVVFQDTVSGGFLGATVAASGDVNGDGYSDIIIGASGEPGRGGGGGRAHIYLGSPHPPEAQSAISTLVGGPDSSGYGSWVAGAGDVNGDGFADAVVSLGSNGQLDPDPCVAHLYFGGVAQRFDESKDGEVSGGPGEKCQLRALGAGDVNADGFSDVVARISRRGEGARLFLGGKNWSNATDFVITLQSGHSCPEVAPVGDMNGDGASDIAVTDRTSSLVAQVSVYLGKPGATASAMSSIAAGAFVKTTDSYTLFGWVARPAGDLNSDGFGDAIIGDQGESDSAGSFYVYFGNGGTVLDLNADGIVVGSSPRRFLGYSVN